MDNNCNDDNFLPIPDAAVPAFCCTKYTLAESCHRLQVTACTAGQTYAVNVYSGSNIASQVIFSVSTGCWAACGGNSTLSTISAVTGADNSGDAGYASQAGIPLPSSYTPVAAAAAEDPMTTNPCLGQDAGFYNGMSSTFFENVFPADSSPKDDFPLAFTGTGSISR